MTKYEQFLDKAGVISEESFNEIIDSLPDFDIDDADFSNLYDFSSKNEILESIFSVILNQWNYVYVDNLDFDSKTIELDDVETIEDLEEIKNTLSKWTISNYEDLKESINEGNKENDEKSLLISLIMDLDINKLKEIVNKYV